MFWKKKKYLDEELGEMTFSSSTWEASLADREVGNFVAFLSGTKESPSHEQLTKAKEVFKKPSASVTAAKEYLDHHSIVETLASEFERRVGELVLDGYDFRYNTNEYDIFFGLTLWPDAVITVHFKDDKACDAVFGD